MAKLRWYQIRLRTIAIGITLIAILLGVFAYYVQPFLVQRSVAADIKEAGGTLESRGGPSWLQSLIGEENCQDITLVNLADIDPSEELLAQVAALPELEILILGGDTINDETLRFVPEGESLQAVILDSTFVSDSGVAALKTRHPHAYVGHCDRRLASIWNDHQGLPANTNFTDMASNPGAVPAALVARVGNAYFEQVFQVCNTDRGLQHQPQPEEMATLPRMRRLTSLDFDDFSPTVADFAIFAQCRHLSKLDLDNAQFSPAEVATKFGNLTELKELSLGNIPITDADVSALAKLPQLWRLDLSGTHVKDPSQWPDLKIRELVLDDTFIEDDDLVALTQFDELESLSLNGTEITDKGLPQLLTLPRLKRLQLRATRITAAGYDTLRQFPSLVELVIATVPLTSGLDPSSDSVRSRVLSKLEPCRWFAPFGPQDEKAYFKEPYEWLRREAWPMQPFDAVAWSPDPQQAADARAALLTRLESVASGSSGTLTLESPEESLHLDLLQDRAGISTVDLSRSYAHDADLEFVASMPDVEVLNLRDTWVSDTGLVHLLKCPRLRELDLRGTTITPAGLAILAQIKTLESLRLPSQTIQASALAQIGQMPNLKAVTFAQPWLRPARNYLAPPLTAEDIDQLAALAQLMLNRVDADQDGSVLPEELPEILLELFADEEKERASRGVFNTTQTSPASPPQINVLTVSDILRILTVGRQLEPQANVRLRDEYDVHLRSRFRK